MSEASARAHPNIALAKYWGKRSSSLNLPAVGSLSLTLAGMETRTSVAFRDDLDADRIELDGAPASEAIRRRISAFLDLIRQEGGTQRRALVRSSNDFPTGAGLASSASGFAALALSAATAAGLELSPNRLSELARRGSGSAPRSLYGGWVRMHRGDQESGADAIATPLHPESHWDLSMLIAITTEHSKSQGSTDGMNLTRDTSPFYDAWIDQSEPLLAAMTSAIASRDLAAVGALMEASCLRMHAVMLSADPGIIYWNPATVAAIERVRELRSSGLACYFTIDAGPQVKVLCEAANAPAISTALADAPGVLRIITTQPGPGAELINE